MKLNNVTFNFKVLSFIRIQKQAEAIMAKPKEILNGVDSSWQYITHLHQVGEGLDLIKNNDRTRHNMNCACARNKTKKGSI